ncbi:DUF504 domain-containing protein [Candidatus Woesearchaeota archaeon]|nr:DUF504 domain-containing protein [Candidatus Woesearchaeota archaeon]
MLTAKEMIDKIKWSNKFNPEDITLTYFDRILNENIIITYKEAKIEDNFIFIEKDNKISEIPLHRLREIKNKGIIIWSRKK